MAHYLSSTPKRSNIVAVSVTLVLFLSNQTHGNPGTDFIIAFPSHPAFADNLYIFCKTYSALKANLTWDIPNIPMGGVIEMTSSTMFFNVSQEDMGLVNSSRGGNALHVTSTKEIVIFASTVWPDTSRGGFLVIPIQQLSTHYLVVTECSTSDCFIIISSPEKDVDINVTLSVLANRNFYYFFGGQIAFKDNIYENGDVIHETLDAWEFMQLLGEKQDLSGTTVQSSKPVAVISGGRYTGIGSDSTVKNMISEQMPPLELLGTKYVIVYLPASVATVVKVTYVEVGTTLRYDKTNLIELPVSNRFRYFHLKVGSATILESDKPVLVELMSYGIRTTVDRIGCFPSGVTLVPTDKWTNKYVGTALKGFVTIIANSSCSNEISYMSNPISEMYNWTAVTESPFVYTQIEVKLVYSFDSTGCAFTGFYFGQGNNYVEARPLGWETTLFEYSANGSIKIPQSSTTHSTMATSLYVTQTSIDLEEASSGSTEDNTLHSDSTSLYVASENSMLFSSQTLFSVTYEPTTLETSCSRDDCLPFSPAVSTPLLSTKTLPASSTASFLMSPESSENIKASATQMSLELFSTISVIDSFDSSVYGTPPLRPSLSLVTLLSTKISQFTPPETTTERVPTAITNTPYINPSSTTIENFSTTIEGTRSSFLDIGQTVKQCPCDCSAKTKATSSNENVQIDELTKDIAEELWIDADTLSATIRKKISAENKVTSAKTLGSTLGVTVLSLVVLFVCVSDFISIVKFCLEKIKSKSKTTNKQEPQ